MNAHEWIGHFAERLGAEAPDEGTFTALLELAAEAAHSSERTAAPIACYLAGRAGADLSTALSVARQIGESD